MNTTNLKPEAFAGVSRQPGPMVRTIRRWFMRSATIVSSKRISSRFLLLDIGGEDLRDAGWVLGKKLQVAIGSGMSSRTYTPIRWDADHGSTTILAYDHGQGAGSSWASEAREGVYCQLLGPRRSLDLSPFAGPMVLFGDETTFGLAAALNSPPSSDNIAYVFEASDACEAVDVLHTVGLHGATVIERTANDDHLATLLSSLASHIDREAVFVLTGKAQSIQYVSRALKSLSVPSSRIKAKAYWAPGKSGLD